jgi:hypothetical protein
MNVRIAAAWLLCCSALTLRAQTDHNTKIYDFCARHQGQPVGDGICHSLVDEALRSVELPADCGLGREIWRMSSSSRGVVVTGDFQKVRPGDIIYFHNISPGRVFRFGSTSQVASGNNHVGVVDSLTLDGVRFYNQNAGHQQRVRLDYFSFRNDISMVNYVAIHRP